MEGTVRDWTASRDEKNLGAVLVAPFWAEMASQEEPSEITEPHGHNTLCHLLAEDRYFLIPPQRLPLWALLYTVSGVVFLIVLVLLSCVLLLSFPAS